ncbi:MAG: hypothetical protein [Staphylococcus phage RP2]|nr:MAG: hypothetical protein [Staphylococcus phage RP2]
MEYPLLSPPFLNSYIVYHRYYKLSIKKDQLFSWS